MINKIIDEFGDSDIKTNINLFEILSPSPKSRANGIPRPQNKFLLFRKNYTKGISKYKKGLVGCNLSTNVGVLFKFSSEHWRNYISDRERKFWHALSIITKKIHSSTYPEYKFNPIKKREKDINRVIKQILLTNLDDNIIENNDSPSEVLDPIDSDLLPCNDDDMIIDQPLNNELYKLFNIDIDSQYNIQDLYYQPTDSILNQNEFSYRYDFNANDLY
jgi:hypothetical protein